MKALYTTKVSATGGRHGHIHSADGLLDLPLALPRELGGRGDATNPETLFAGGYSACFENAILHIARNKGRHFADEDVHVEIEISLGRNEAGGFYLSAAIVATIAGVEQATAEELVTEADKICPYSNAIRGNVEVSIEVRAKEAGGQTV